MIALSSRPSAFPSYRGASSLHAWSAFFSRSAVVNAIMIRFA